MTINAIVLAAGKGTRMFSDRAKVLHEAAGLPLVRWMHRIAVDAGADQVVVVVGHQADQVAGHPPRGHGRRPSRPSNSGPVMPRPSPSSSSSRATWWWCCPVTCRSSGPRPSPPWSPPTPRPAPPPRC